MSNTYFICSKYLFCISDIIHELFLIASNEKIAIVDKRFFSIMQLWTYSGGTSKHEMTNQKYKRCPAQPIKQLSLTACAVDAAAFLERTKSITHSITRSSVRIKTSRTSSIGILIPFSITISLSKPSTFFTLPVTSIYAPPALRSSGLK